MTVSYSPALDVSDDPARQPNERPFVPSAGGAPAFDIDSIYGASDVGDFYATLTTQYTDAGSTLATSSGDVIQQWNGGRTTGTSITIRQLTAAYRPELATDGTYTLSTYWPGGALKFISEEAFGDPIKLFGVRFRLNAISTGASTSNGFSTLAEDFYPIVDGPGISESRQTTIEGGARYNGSTVGDTSWHTMVAYHDGTNLKVFIDDMDTADIDQVSSLPNLSNLRAGHNTTFNHGMHIHRMMCHTTWDAATPAELASWLEAS